MKTPQPDHLTSASNASLDWTFSSCQRFRNSEIQLCLQFSSSSSSPIFSLPTILEQMWRSFFKRKALWNNETTTQIIPLLTVGQVKPTDKIYSLFPRIFPRKFPENQTVRIADCGQTGQKWKTKYLKSGCFLSSNYPLDWGAKGSTS